LPGAAFEKIAFSFAPGFLDKIPADTDCLIQNGENGPVWQFRMRPFGRAMAVGMIGGRGASRLHQMGTENSEHAALGALMSAFGPALKGAVVASHCTDWASDEWSYGSFSLLKIGALHAREDMARPLDKRLFFAGEATASPWPATAPGAYLSGVRAAGEAMKWLKP
jgi:monoamine oxidase